MTIQSNPLITALEAVLTDASPRLRLPVEEVLVIRVEAARWPDACLGLGKSGEACAEVMTRGYRIRLRGGTTYRTDLAGNIRLEKRTIGRPQDAPTHDELHLHYTVSGGLTGRKDEFETDSSRLTASEARELRSLITDADFFNAPTGRASEVPDGKTYRLWVAVGRRNRELVRGEGVDIKSSDALKALVAWVEERMPT